VSGMPTGVTVALAPAAVAMGGTARMVVTAGESAPRRNR
jgi:hypothetical protein